MTAEEVLQGYLRPYQREWIEDRSRRKICLKSRRIGMSEALVLEAVLLALRQPYHDVYLCSTSFTNAKDLLRRISIWIQVFERAGKPLPVHADQKTVVEFENGSRIIPMPALSVRGGTGTVILDEFAFYQWDREVWRAVGPVADTDPSMQVIVVSTPWGASGTFWELWHDPDDQHGEWSRHKIDVYDAAAEGFPVEPAELEQRYPSDIFRQEFCCEFLSDIDQYFGYDLIRRAQYSPVDIEELAWSEGRPVAGIDVASQQDASIFADACEHPEGFYLRDAIAIKQAGEVRDYTPQFEDIKSHLGERPYEAVGVDATGEGAQLGQDLAREFGAAIKAVTSGDWSEVKARIPKVRMAMEKGELQIPNDPKVRHAFAKIQRKETTSNKVKFEASRDAEGHADEFFATLLAWDAAKSAQRERNRRRRGDDKPRVHHQEAPL